MTSVSCSWCHTINLIDPRGPTACRECGHQVGVPRMDCRCGRCGTGRRLMAAVLAADAEEGDEE